MWLVMPTKGLIRISAEEQSTQAACKIGSELGPKYFCYTGLISAQIDIVSRYDVDIWFSCSRIPAPMPTEAEARGAGLWTCS